MTTILGLSGSLRAGSFNSGLLRAAAAAMPEGATLVIGSIRGVPLYDGDDEAANGTPPAVETLRRQVAGADALLFATPEYNNGIPGVFKNAIDWMSSGKGGEVFRGKPVALMGASPKSYGTILSQTAWLPVLRALRLRPWLEGRVMLGNARKLFDAEGNLTDPAALGEVRSFVAGFVGSLTPR